MGAPIISRENFDVITSLYSSTITQKESYLIFSEYLKSLRCPGIVVYFIFSIKDNP